MGKGCSIESGGQGLGAKAQEDWSREEKSQVTF